MSEEIDKVRQAIRLLSDNNLSELTLEEDGGFRVTVKAEALSAPLSYAPALPAPISMPTPPRASAAVQPAKPAPTASEGFALSSPMVGVFYNSPAPDEPPFLNPGDMVKVGQTIGLIEAMKVFSEVPAEVAGRVLAIPAKSGQLVQQGQPLVYIEPS